MCHDRKQRNNYYSQSGYLYERDQGNSEKGCHIFYYKSFNTICKKRKKSMGKKDLGKIIHMPLLYVLIYLLIISIIMIHAL